MTQIPPLAGSLSNILAGQEPSNVPAFLRRYQDPTVASLPPAYLNPLMTLDYNRVARGQNLIPKDQLPFLVQSMSTGAPSAATQKQEKPSVLEDITGLLGRAGKDIAQIGLSIPHIPSALVREGQQLPELPTDIQRAVSSGHYSQIFKAPGIRLIPGTYLAGTGPKAFWEHPVQALLDVAPYAAGAMKIPAVNEGVTGAKEALAESRLGTAIRESTPVQAYVERFGQQARETSRVAVQYGRRMQQDFINFGRRLNTMRERFGVEPARVEELTRIGTTDPITISSLPANEQGYLSAVRRMTDDQVQKWVDAGYMGIHEGEAYPIRQYSRLEELQTRYQDALANRDVKAAADARAKYDNYFEETPPMRFRPLLQRDFANRLTELARSRVPADNAEAWGHVQEGIQNGLWSRLANTVGVEEMAKLREDVTPNWVTMKEQGLDPVPLFDVTEGQAREMIRPTVYPAANFNPKSIKDDTWNTVPGIQNFQVGLGRNEYEWLRQNVTAQAIDRIMEIYGQRRSAIQEGYMPAARDVASRSQETVAHYLQKTVDKHWVEWHPESIFPWRKGSVQDITDTDPIMVPKGVQKTIDDLYKHQGGALEKFTTGVQKPFKLSVLGFSPRWHLYNLLGGMTMLMGQTGPSVFKYLGEARQMLKDGTIPESLSRGYMDIPTEAQIWHNQQGAKMGLMSKEREAVLGAAGKAVNKVYDYQNMIDNMYRSMSYLYGKDKALKKGLTVAEAEERGAKLANKVLQDWDSMTPFERNVIRSVVPFYGWARHILRYTFHYPWDHPLRAGIIGAFARNEINDWSKGLPAQWQNYFFLGNPDSKGNQKAVRIGGANPFGDVANYFTLGGFFSQLNPIAGGLFDAAGLNPITGKADLYPELHYNEETGRLEPKTKPVWQAVTESLLPPLPLARAGANMLHIPGLGHVPFIGPSAQESRMQRTSPDAYRQMLASAAGIPFVPREVNRTLELGRTELIRQQEMRDTLKNAMKSGDYRDAMKYPALRPIIAALHQLAAAGELGQYQIKPPPAGVLGSADILQALVGGR